MYYFGSYLGSGLISYAADEQNDKTNISNVTFEAYFKDNNEQKVYSKETDITSELTLYLAIGVKEGTLKNFKIDFENTNFKLKDGRTKIEATQINATETKEISLPIVAKNDSNFNLGLLNMDNKIKITGKYISNNNEQTDLNTEKTISIKWDSSNLNSKSEGITTLKTEIITNKTYTIGEAQKRLIQVKVKSGIKNNIYPIEKTTITVNPLKAGEINESQFTNGTKLTAEDVTVSAYSTMATNGKDGSVNFGKVEENKLGAWQYNSETGATTITINNTKDENNNVAWAKNAVDEFIVTYIYNEESVKNAKAFNISAENDIKLYTYTGEHKTASTYWETNTEKAMPIELNIQAPESLSKKYISTTGKDFKETLTLNISTTKLEKNIFAVSSMDRLNISDEDETKVKPSTTYKATYINKEEFINILGENGEVAILDMATEAELGKITKDSVDSNNEELLSFTYPSNVNLIGIQLSKPVKAGKLNIENSKNLNIANTTEYTSNIDKLNKLTLSSLAAIQNIEDSEAVYTTDAQLKEIAVTNTETNIELGVNLGQDKTTLPVGIKNTVDFTVTLKTSGENDKLFSNPTVQIKLPEEAKEIAVVEDSKDLAHANGLEIESWKVSGNIIEIKLKGDQTKASAYDGQDTTITFSAEFSTQKLLPTFTKNIDLIVANGEEQKTSSKQVTFSAEKGILLANSISNYNGTEPSISAFKNEEKSGLLNSESDKAVTATGEATIINNTGSKIENAEVIGKGNVKVAMQGATIAYTKDQEVTQNSNWNTAEYSQDVTGYKITIPAIENAGTVKFAYELTIPANLGTNKTIELQYTVYNGTVQTLSPKITLTTNTTTEEPGENPGGEEPSSEYKLELTMESSVPTTQTLLPGQEITYTINIKNANDQEHSIIVEGKMQNGLMLDAAVKTIGEMSEDMQWFSETENRAEIDLLANQTLNIVIKAHVSQEIDVKEIENKISAVIKLPNESGLSEDEEKCYVGKVEKSLKHNVKPNIPLKGIEIPEEITLKVGEKKTLEIKLNPTDASTENLKITVDDSKIATVTNAGVIEGIAEGETVVSVFTEDRVIGENCKVKVVNNTTPGDPEKPTPEPDDPDNPTPKPEDPDNPAEKTYTISGVAWLDENENGQKESSERLLKGILVKIKQINKDNVAEYLKGEDGKEITAITDNEGKYEFKDLKPGKYIVEFEYNTKTYMLTPVTNKDSVPTAPTTAEGTTVKTDTLNITNENIENINIGLVLNSKFDLELNKYITKVTVQNNSGTTEYNYNNEQLAKVEIKAKQMASSTVLVEYQIEVKNNGAVPGTATVIADYLPKGLKFNSEMNTNWYQGTDGNLYTEELKDIMLEPGESKQVKLVLTKAMTSNSTGTFTNAAEIYEDKNDFGLVDTNSTPANQEQKENDYSTAELLISTATGSPMMYIGIIIASMLILGGGIYLINKKVILEKNI